MCRGERLEGGASGYWTLSVKQSSGRQPLGFKALALRSPILRDPRRNRMSLTTFSSALP